MEGEKKSKKRLIDGGGWGADKYIFVLCFCLGHWFSFNVSGEDGEFPPMLLSPGDCHQFASWHLNHPLQIGVFEMQIQLRLPRQIKRHREEWEKNTSEDITFYSFFYHQSLSNTFCSLSLSRERERQRGQTVPAKRYTNCLCIYL